MTDNVKAIKLYAFQNCKNSKNINLSSSLTEIDELTFYKCSSLEEITIPEGVKEINRSAFAHCTNLKTINFSSTVEVINKYAFYDCSELETLTIPGNVKTIEKLAFKNCTKLKNLKLKNGIETINKGAFRNCVNIKKVKIPASVTSVYGSFAGCKNLKKIKVNENNEKYCEINGVLFSKEHEENQNFTKSLVLYPAGKKNKTYKVPDNTTGIIGKSFTSNKHLEKVVLPDSVKWIGADAFKGCGALRSINIPEKVTDIYGCAFLNCTKLKSITIPNPETNISSYCTFGYYGSTPYEEEKYDDFTISAPFNSSAEDYAINNKFKFINIGKPYIIPSIKSLYSVGETYDISKELKGVTKVVYKSKNKDIASVSNKGIVKFKSEGKAKVTVKMTNQNGTAKQTIKFNVAKK